MNSKQSRTLALIFRNPIPTTMTWVDIESLLLAIGAELTEGSGSRVRFEKDGEVAVFHRPHPSKEVKRYVVRDAQLFLSRIGVKP